jgi:hypothetical protein
VVEPYPSEKYEFVSWGYDIPNIWKNNPVMFQTTNQIFSCFSRGIQAEIMETSMVRFDDFPGLAWLPGGCMVGDVDWSIQMASPVGG